MKIAVIGGHMAPALGFISAIPKGIDIVYFGREHVFEGDSGESLEVKMAKEYGAKFIPFHTGRIQRVLTPHTFPSLIQIPQGFRAAFSLLKKEKPDVLIGFGGYLSVPLGVAAYFLRIPFIIHESTLEAGLANKFLASFAKKICISWESSWQYFPVKKTILTGNPLLSFDTKLDPSLLPESHEKLPLLVVTGGSGGSHNINNYILQILPELLEIAKITHITGDAKQFDDFDKLVQKKKNLPKKLQSRYAVMKFVDPRKINALFQKADGVIGRSGINTVTALLLLHKKAILIPLVFGQKNEQLKNAQLLESEGLAKIIPQQTLSPKLLFEEIKKMLRSPKAEVKWHIPVVTSGSENLVKEVMKCLPARPNEE